jgi:hypothetical protein
MRRLRWLQNLRTAAVTLTFCSVLAGIVALLWMNHNGLPASWREALEKELAKNGLHVHLGPLRYEIFHGIVARNVQVYNDESRTREVARLERIVLDLDKTKLMRGDVVMTRFEFHDAHLGLPVDPDHKDSPLLEVSGLNGTVLMPGGRLIEVRDVHGMLGGLAVDFNAHIQGYRPIASRNETPDDHNMAIRLLARQITDELNKWSFNPAKPPHLRVFLDADLTALSTLRSRLRFDGSDLAKNGYTFRRLTADGEINGSLLTLTSLHAEDGGGKLEARVDYDINRREGRFDAVSGIRLPDLLRSLFGIQGIHDLSLGGTPKIEASGDFQVPENAAPVVSATGRLACDSLTTHGISFDTVGTSFSWNAGKFYLRDVRATAPGGTATGKVLIDGSEVRYAVSSSLPITYYRPFFNNLPLGKVLHDFAENNHTKVDVSIEGRCDLSDQTQWAAWGRAAVERVSYRGVPLKSVSADMTLSHEELDFKNGAIEFDYTDYPLRKAYQGPLTGSTRVKRVRYDHLSDEVEIDQITGMMWPAPVIRMFNPPLANDLEIYRFQSPPELAASGIIDLQPKNRTDFRISFRNAKSADYTFLGKTINLVQPSGIVHLRGQDVNVDNLKCHVFGGPLEGNIIYDPARNGGMMRGDLNWTRLSMAELASTYQINNNAGGQLTGRIEFSGPTRGVKQLNGKGLLAINNAELFSVPILGPLSPLISGVLADRRAGFQHAKDAFFTFRINDGILTTTDFRTLTPSMVFTGDAVVDLDRKTLDMTMRMNARGFLGLITLPLRPFYGLFQFRGTGPLDQPKWENVMFTSPPEEQKGTLLSPPKARPVAEP